MKETLTSDELVQAREWIENCLDGLNDGMAATNTSLVNAIENLIDVKLKGYYKLIDKSDDI